MVRPPGQSCNLCAFYRGPADAESAVCGRYPDPPAHHEGAAEDWEPRHTPAGEWCREFSLREDAPRAKAKRKRAA